MLRLHGAVIALINHTQDESAKVSVGMMEMYEYLCVRNIDRVTEVRIMLSQLR